MLGNNIPLRSIPTFSSSTTHTYATRPYTRASTYQHPSIHILFISSYFSRDSGTVPLKYSYCLNAILQRLVHFKAKYTSSNFPRAFSLCRSSSSSSTSCRYSRRNPIESSAQKFAFDHAFGKIRTVCCLSVCIKSIAFLASRLSSSNRLIRAFVRTQSVAKSFVAVSSDLVGRCWNRM